METFFSFLERRVDDCSSLLCIGLDPHIPDLKEASAASALDFCLTLVKQTAPYAAAFKPNAAFFEIFVAEGWTALKQVIEAISEESNRLGSMIPVILDAKRGDIASTAEAYAQSAFEHLGAHCITLNPYLGKDSIDPFIKDHEKGVFLLCKTSNPGSGDLQDVHLENGLTLYEHVAKLAQGWNTKNNIGLVVGATHLDAMKRVRAAAPDLWFLAPGVGAQGGELESALKAGLRKDGKGILFPVSRGISRASNPTKAAAELRDEIISIKRDMAFKELVSDDIIIHLSDTNWSIMIESRLFERIERKKSQLDGLRPFPIEVVARLREQILVEWIYNSNAIEGSTITLQETRLILETGLTIGGKTLREHFEVTNHRDAIRYVEQFVAQNESITPFHVRQIHKLVLSQIDDASAGNYRTTQVRIAGARHVPPESWEISSRMTEWGEWLVQAQENTHPVILAALAHHRLVEIHPFVDGNGRTARLIMNLLLMQHGYPPTVILKTDRQSYYRVLSLADSGKEKSLINFVGKAVERSLTLYFEACVKRIVEPNNNDLWISLADATKGTSYSQEYLSLLARMGRIEAVKRGRNWFTTHQAIQNYIKTLGKKESS